jgi:hypothetical protein
MHDPDTNPLIKVTSRYFSILLQSLTTFIAHNLKSSKTFF